MKKKWRIVSAGLLAASISAWCGPELQGYVLRFTSLGMPPYSGNAPTPSCLRLPSPSSTAGIVSVRWSASFSANAVRVIAQSPTSEGRLDEVEGAVEEAVIPQPQRNYSSLQPDVRVRVTRVAAPRACGIDGLVSICFDQADMAFTPGVLAITRVVIADRGSTPARADLASPGNTPSLDADIYFNPSISPESFATPAALAQNPKSYDLQAVLRHEWRSIPIAGIPVNPDGPSGSCPSFAVTFLNAASFTPHTGN